MAQSSLGPISSCQWELSWLPDFLKMESSACVSQLEVAPGQHLTLLFGSKWRALCVPGAAALTHIPETGRLGQLFRESWLPLHLSPQPTRDFRLPSVTGQHCAWKSGPGQRGTCSGQVQDRWQLAQATHGKANGIFLDEEWGEMG